MLRKTRPDHFLEATSNYPKTRETTSTLEIGHPREVEVYHCPGSLALRRTKNKFVKQSFIKSGYPAIFVNEVIQDFQNPKVAKRSISTRAYYSQSLIGKIARSSSNKNCAQFLMSTNNHNQQNRPENIETTLIFSCYNLTMLCSLLDKNKNSAQKQFYIARFYPEHCTQASTINFCILQAHFEFCRIDTLLDYERETTRSLTLSMISIN